MDCGNDSTSGRGTHFRSRFPSADTGELQNKKGLVGDYSLLPKVLQAITISHWRSTKVGRRTFSRSKIDNRLEIGEDSLFNVLKVLHESAINAYSLLAIANNDKTQI